MCARFGVRGWEKEKGWFVEGQVVGSNWAHVEWRRSQGSSDARLTAIGRRLITSQRGNVTSILVLAQLR